MYESADSPLPQPGDVSLREVPIDALSQRISCRAFIDKPVEDEKTELLREEMGRINAACGLSFQLFGKHEGKLELNSRMFSSQAPCYLAYVGPQTDQGKELVGYFGEHLVLLATSLGLGTCWVAGTFNRKTVEARVAGDEFLHDVIPFGYAPEKMPFKVRAIRSSIRKRSRSLPSFLPDADWDQVPAWVRAGIQAVAEGPSAVNAQPVSFGWNGDALSIRLTKHKLGLEETDLGIAKYNFELAARAAGHTGHWQWGDGAQFL
ncbi:MAG: nitroreductase family protein [Coriobacteriales bacterium]|nr:nitroreductase family protein [Coriobacteriales bacterium]